MDPAQALVFNWQKHQGLSVVKATHKSNIGTEGYHEMALQIKHAGVYNNNI